MPTILDEDIRKYEAFLENTADSLRRCLPQEEFYHHRQMDAYKNVLAALQDLHKVLFKKSYTVQPFVKASAMVEFSLIKTFDDYAEALVYGKNLPDHLDFRILTIG